MELRKIRARIESEPTAYACPVQHAYEVKDVPAEPSPDSPLFTNRAARRAALASERKRK
jgi:hypothetical protein